MDQCPPPSVSGGFRPIVLAVCLAVAARSVVAADVDFNRDIRALLSRHCLKCHGRDDAHRQASLRLDRRDVATSRLESGQVAIVPGRPGHSELVRRITSPDPDLRMPPQDTANALGQRDIALLTRWIAEGAEYARHWAFVPPRPQEPPATRGAWITRNAIDRFIQARIADAGLAPSPPADRETLIRRLSLDLRGLPATPAEVDRFMADRAPGAWPRLADRLLADPSFGERWGQVWLDLARYADSRGYGSDPLRLNAWRFRDWVIDALNANQPFDEFTIHQLAGDLLPDATLDQKIATAFHRNTMTNTEGGTDDEEFRVAAVKDRADTTIQVWMGLTMRCAGCHDHKYDPITQRDYYRFFAIFNQTADADRSDDSPLIDAPRSIDLLEIAARDRQIKAIEAERKALEPKLAAERKQAEARPVTGRIVRIELGGKDRILSLAEVQVMVGNKNVAPQGKARQSSTAFEGPAKLAIDGNTKGHYFEAKSTTHTAKQADPWWEVDLGSDVAVERIEIFGRTDGGLFNRNAGLLIRLLDKDRKTTWEQRLKDKPAARHTFIAAAPGPVALQSQALADRLATLKKSRPKVPTLPIMQELPPEKQRETFVMLRGSFLQRGDKVVRGVPDSFHGLPAGNEPTRLGVARWLVADDNPLTARVGANRLWARLFGRGLVATEEDFGTQGEPPSHPELLDWLATEFVRSDWDVKRLMRLIVNSATYRQSSRVDAARLAADPSNRLLARGPRYRLEAEMIRDQALAVSGLLDRRLGGPSVYPYQPPGLWQAAFNGQRKWPLSTGSQKHRRGLYTFWRRTVPYPSMSTFDAPSRETCSVRRVPTNTPLQAFVTLNDPVYVEAAQALARRLVGEGGATTEQRLRFGLRLVLGRQPTPEQVALLAALFKSEHEHYRGHGDAARQLATDPLGPLPPGRDAAELAAWTVVANVMLNLDAVLTRG